MTSILFTQCLQRDFVSPIGRFDPLPNLLHVGYSEALRLMGDKPEQGPVSRVMTWAYQQPEEELMLIHLRDWHDASDPTQAEHLKRFGNHCLQNSPGANFAFPQVDGPRKVEVVNSLSLNDFRSSALEALLRPFEALRARVGIMGAWTEAKVYFLAYELRTRYPNFDLAVCSALTASSSRARHFEALDQMERILGVQIVHSVGEFIDFLGGQDLETPLLGLPERFPQIQSPQELAPSDRVLLRYLFRDCRELKLKVLDGGFSGNMVLGTESVDLHGHDQVPHVVKIGSQELMGKERVAFERIQHVLGNNAPHISDFVDYEDKGAIKYRYASMGGAFSTTFQKLVEGGAVQEKIDRVLDSVFAEQLHRLYKAGTLEESDLLEHYQFSSRWASGVRRRVEALLGHEVEHSSLTILPGVESPSLIDFYEKTLDRLPRGGRFYQSFVHGDLNGANIIVDGHGNVWLIDFFHTRRAHILMDLIKLENDLLYIFTKLESPVELRTACSLFDHLLDCDDLAAGLPELHFESEKFQRTWNTLRKLRSFYARLIHSDRSPYQWWVGALRYAAHSLGFDECSPLQKKSALYAAGHLSRKITDLHVNSSHLRVDWLKSGVGLTILPGRADRHRDLGSDLEDLRKQGVSAVVCMVPIEELEVYGVPHLLEEYREAGFQLLHFPVVDQKVCSLEELAEGVKWIEEELGRGHKVLLHCVGGLGRSGFMAAAHLVFLGQTPQEAISAVRDCRSPRAVETKIQEELIRQYAQILDYSSRKARL